jgi:predicted lipoprotein with Yx(FWY)xxD motif
VAERTPARGGRSEDHVLTRRSWAATALALGALALAACTAPSTPDVAITGSPTTGSTTTGSPTTGSTTAAGASPTTAGGVATTAPTATTGTIRAISTPYGPALGQGEGKVIYTWDRESDGTTLCNDPECLATWPPVLVAGTTVPTEATLAIDAGRFSVVPGPTGGLQATLDGRRLYTMAADRPGQANCQGSDGWWIIHPDGTPNTATTPGGASATTR